MIKKLLLIVCFVACLSMLSGCLDSVIQSNMDQALVGTWESGVINGYYIHQKIFGADGSFTSRWLYATGRAEYSEISGTWTADGHTLTTVTNHTDVYTYTFIGSNSFNLQWDDESRIYWKAD